MVVVKQLDSPDCTFNVYGCTRLRQLRQQIQEATQIPVQQQRLLRSGTFIPFTDDDKQLMQLNFAPFTVLHLVKNAPRTRTEPSATPASVPPPTNTSNAAPAAAAPSRPQTTTAPSPAAAAENRRRPRAPSAVEPDVDYPHLCPQFDKLKVIEQRLGMTPMDDAKTALREYHRKEDRKTFMRVLQIFIKRLNAVRAHLDSAYFAVVAENCVSLDINVGYSEIWNQIYTLFGRIQYA